MNILGINCYAHDTSAALLMDGRPVAVGEQERFDREKHSYAFPDDAIAFCLGEGGITIADVDVVAFGHDAASGFARGAADALGRFPRGAKRLTVHARADLGRRRRRRGFLERWGFGGTVVDVGHHRAHAAAAFLSSPFEDAAVLTVDRGGDFLSTTGGHGRGVRVHPLVEIRQPHSLGEVYTAVTSWLGFAPHSGEGTVMGLAPYGGDACVEAFRDLVRLHPPGEFRVDLDWFRYQLGGGPVSRRFLDRFGPAREPGGGLDDRHRDVAFALQAVTEEAAVHVARALHERTGSRNLALGGGLALNSAMNARLLADTPFEEVFVQPAAGDAGNALGAALHVWHEVLARPREWRMDHAYLGSGFGRGEVERALAGRGLRARAAGDPADAAAELLSRSKIVGWFQGRAEVGPRALGARSILADPRRADMRDVLNARIKRREPFRPFAPSVLHERGADWFAGYRNNPFMLLVQPVRADRRDAIPAVTHVDGTARLQSVDGASPLFRRLLERFDARTGVPVVLNTSFNLRGEPIVQRPEEAVADFLATDMDALVLGDVVVEKDA
ncbi:MAG TPA: carbamoyltransferase C-terminal domain-containing protein [Solirubrobacteraceae bacterium]|nr:carbamoyltransferase C-terminal domain-containing protein [Solirubrobacteraceae bacterium]